MNRHAAIQALAALPNVGERLATRIYEELGVASVTQLLDAAVSHRLQSLPGIGSRREQQILEAARSACPTQLVDVLRCPACGNTDLAVRSTAVKCSLCERQYAIDHGVVDLEPPNVRDRSVAQRLMESRFYARVYEDVMRPKLTTVVTDRTMPQEYGLATRYLQLDKATAILDVACGTGNFTRHFAQKLTELNRPALLVGADVSWPMLETARTYLRADGLEEAVHLMRADASSFPIGNQTFDRIHCAGALHLMVDVDLVLAEFARVLEPGGICVMSTFITGPSLVQRAFRRLAERPSGFYRFRPDELQGRLADHGLAVFVENVEGEAITLAARRVA